MTAIRKIKENTETLKIQAMNGHGPAKQSGASVPSLLVLWGALFYEALLSISIIFLLWFVASLLLESARMKQLLVFVGLGGYFGYCWMRGQTLAMRAWKLVFVLPPNAAAQERQPAMPIPPTQKSMQKLPGLGWKTAALRYVLGWIWVLPPLLGYHGLQKFSPSMGFSLAQLGVFFLVWGLFWTLPAKHKGAYWHDRLLGLRLGRLIALREDGIA